MKELIERLEKATGPDRELDAEIYQAVTGDEPVMIFPDSFGPGEKVQRVGMADGKYVSRYTSSIDAALTLVPEGWEWSLFFESGCYRVEVGDPLLPLNGEANNPALALCIAALRARQHSPAESKVVAE